MFRLNGTYGAVSRLTLDGRGVAQTGILRDGEYGTDWRITDVFVKDVKGAGIQWGGDSGQGEDLSVMMRRRFTRCGIGITATNQNAMGPYAWYCLFEDCGVGMDNMVGFVHSIGNVYLRSRECDIKNGYIGYMILNNTSIDSQRFLGFIEEKTMCMANNNKIYNTRDPVAMQGVGVMLDNVIRSRSNAGPALLLGRPNTLAVGNTFTVKSPVQSIYNPKLAIDHNPATYCYDPNALKFSASPTGTGGFELIWTLPAAGTAVATSYTITNGVLPIADPKAFQLQGSDDGHSWTTLDSRIDQRWQKRQEKHVFTFNNATAYHAYRLYVTANQNSPVNTCGDLKGGVQVAEWELLDEKGKNLLDEKNGAISGRLPDFSLNYTGLEEKIVDPSRLPVPATVSLPGTPQNKHRKVFEVQLRTGDDAREIQRQLDAAAREPVGSNPIVHLPHGTYMLTRTVVLPAHFALQLGDAGRDGSALAWNGTGNGPLLRFLGPSRVTMKEMVLNSGTADAVSVENCDQDGGRIYCDQVDCFGGYGDGTKWADTDFLIDGVERATCSSSTITSAARRRRLRSRPPGVAAGGATKGQVAFLMGYVWGDYSPTYLNVKNGGRLLFCGYRAENSQKGRLPWTPHRPAV